jgi:hypothetical protein
MISAWANLVSQLPKEKRAAFPKRIVFEQPAWEVVEKR